MELINSMLVASISGAWQRFQHLRGTSGFQQQNLLILVSAGGGIDGVSHELSFQQLFKQVSRRTPVATKTLAVKVDNPLLKLKF